MPKDVPSLQELAADVIYKTNPHLFFKLYKQDRISESRIIYIDYIVQSEMKKHHIYLQNIHARDKKISDISKRLANDKCFSQTVLTVLGITLGGLYLGIGMPIVEAVNASLGSRIAYYTFALIAPIVGCGIGACMTSKVAELVAECTTPQVPPDEAIDLEAGRPRLR